MPGPRTTEVAVEARELASGVDALYLSGHGAVHPDVLTELAHQRDLAEIRLPATYCLGSLPFAVAAHGWGKYHYCLDHPIGRIGMSRAGTSHRYGSSRARRRRHRSSSDSGGGGGPGPSGASHPCRIVGDGSDRPPERPMLTVAEVEAVTEAMSERLRAAVLLASWGGLRRGEIRGLQRRDVNELAGGVAVERTLHELHTGEVVYGPHKSKAGARFVHLPKPIVTVLPAHLDAHVAANPQSPVFPSTTGGPMRPRFL